MAVLLEPTLCIQEALPFKKSVRTPCFKVGNSRIALDHREMIEIGCKKLRIGRCLKSFPPGLLKGATIWKGT